MTTTRYYAMCKICKLGIEDLENMTVDMTFRYFDDYFDIKNPESAKQNKVIQYADEAPDYI